MKEFMNKYFSKFISMVTLNFGLIIIVVSSILLGLSVEIRADEYGTDISLNKDYIIFIIIGLGLLIGGIFAFLKAIKEESVKGSLVISYGFSSTMLTFYSLTCIFKTIQNSKILDKLAAISPYLSYLVIGLLILCLVIEIGFFIYKKERE